MKKNNLILIVFLMLIATTFTEICLSDNQTLNIDEIFSRNPSSITSEINISGNITIGNPENLRLIKITLNDFPYSDFRQKIISKTFIPKENFRDSEENIIQTNSPNQIYFQFSNPKENKIEYIASAKLISERKEKEVPLMKNGDLQRYPIISLPKEAESFILPTKLVNSAEPEIIAAAHEIIGKDKDLFSIVSKIAFWTHSNMEYNLKLNKENPNSLWILENKKGTCKEYTHLFIALVRSLGIPAKFISGIAYTNSDLFEDKWGPHAWAEVYFPETGWVPFDPTYGQFGFLDASHIKLKEAEDSSADSVSLRWKERGLSNIKIGNINIKPSLLNATYDKEEPFSIKTSPYFSEIGLDSYNLIVLEAVNNKNSYYAPILTLRNVTGIEIISQPSVLGLLKPYEKKKFYWIIKAGSTFEKGYIYTIPYKITSTINNITGNNYILHENAKTYTLEDINKIIQTLEQGYENNYNNSLYNEIKMICKTSSDEEIYIDDIAEIICKLKNIGNNKELSLCLENDCKILNLEYDEEKSISFYKNITSTTKQVSLITLSYSSTNLSNEEPRKEAIIIPIYEVPSLIISDIKYPFEVNFSDVFEIEFTIERETKSIPRDLTLTILFPYSRKEEIKASDLKDYRDIILKIPANSLNKGNNKISFIINYKDQKGREYSYEKKISISVVNVGFFDNISLFFRNLKYSITKKP